MIICEKCNSKYVPGIGYGPQDYCNFCANRVVAKLQAENEKLKKALGLAASQLAYVGCISGCDGGVLVDPSGEPWQCQWCDEQETIRNTFKAFPCQPTG